MLIYEVSCPVVTWMSWFVYVHTWTSDISRFQPSCIFLHGKPTSNLWTLLECTSLRVIEIMPGVKVIEDKEKHIFVQPVKRINEVPDVSSFMLSKAYADIMTFLLQLNASIFPSKDDSDRVQKWELGRSSETHSPVIQNLQILLLKLEENINEAPPDVGPHRFGNPSFRRWCSSLEARVDQYLEKALPPDILSLKGRDESAFSAKDEVKPYLLGAFGSSQRLDYGTGHELSFLAFLGCLAKLGGFHFDGQGAEERALVLGVIEP